MIFSVIVTAAIFIVIAAACIRTVCISGGFGMSGRSKLLCTAHTHSPDAARRSTYIKIFGAAQAL